MTSIYHFKEVTIKNKQNTQRKTVLVIEFTDPSMAIIGEFLMTDASLLNGNMLTEIEAVLAHKTKSKTISGHRCSLEIKPDRTIVSDLFEDMFDGLETYPPYEIETDKLRDLMVMWEKGKEVFAQKEKNK